MAASVCVRAYEMCVCVYMRPQMKGPCFNTLQRQTTTFPAHFEGHWG